MSLDTHTLARRALFTATSAAIVACGLTLARPGLAGAQEGQEAGGQKADEKPAAAREPVDFRKLKEYFPAELAGLKRTEAKGQKMNMGEMKLTQAEANYGQEDKTLHITLTDYSAQPDMVAGLSFWQQMEIDTESDTGHEKTLKIDGFPAMETFNLNAEEGSEKGSGSITAIVGGRIMLQFDANGVTAKELADVRGKLELKKLAAMLDGGATTQPATKPAE